jgi:transposase-like protein
VRRPIHTSRQKNISTINKHDTQARARFLTRNGQALLPKIHAVFGAANPVQRCRHHKIGKVMSYLPKHLKEQTKAALRAGFRLPAAEGMVRLENQAQWLEREHQDAAASLREYTEEMFTSTGWGCRPRCAAA